MPGNTVSRVCVSAPGGKFNNIIDLISERGIFLRKIATTLNCILLGVIGFLLFLSVRTWTHPQYSLDIPAEAASPQPAPPQVIPVGNNPYHPGVIQSIVQSNLFRKERRDHTPPAAPPPPPRPAAPPPPRVPPPDLKLTGVMLLPGKPLAFLEGNLSVLEANRSIRKKPVKRKGYPLGAQIGEYRLARIDKTEAILDNQRGATLRLKLAKKGTGDPIQRNGNAFTQKSASFNPGTIRAIQQPKKRVAPMPRPTHQPRRIPTARSIRISGAAMPPAAANKNKTQKKRPVGIPRPRISGR